MNKHQKLELPGRRALLLLTGKSAAGLMAASAMGIFNTSALAGFNLTPIVTEGPFCLDSVANNLFRTDIRMSSVTGTVATGYPLVLTVTVSKLNSNGSVSPISGVYVDIWHCDANGNYSGETNNGAADLTAEDYLRGYQITNARGSARFITIYPGWYQGRTTHIHARIRTFSGSTAVYDQTTQFYFDENITDQIYTGVSQYIAKGLNSTSNETDGIYTGGSEQVAVDKISTLAGSYTLLTMANNGTYVNASIHVIIATSEGVATLNCPTTASGSNTGAPGGTPPGGTPPGGVPPGG